MKSNETLENQEHFIQHLFIEISEKYDLVNWLMTFGQYKRWQRETIRRANLSTEDKVIDIGSGTGDLTVEGCRFFPGIKIFSVDLTFQMLSFGRKKRNLSAINANAHHLPFSDGEFDAAVSGFLMRNAADLKAVIEDQFRILKPGGRITFLDTTKPATGLFSPFIWMYMHFLIPVIGGIVSGHAGAYKYLVSSTEHFISAEEMAKNLAASGFTQVGFQRYMLGTIAVHWGTKPEY